MRRCILGVVALLIGGCSLLPAYKEPEEGPRGRIRFQGVGMTLTSYAESDCRDRSEIGSINGFMLDHFRSRGMPPRLVDSIPATETWVPANRPFYGALSRYISGYYKSYLCAAPVSFIPEEDGDYDLDLEIFDAGNPPQRYCRGKVEKLTVNAAGEVERTPIVLDRFSCPD